MAPDGSCLCVVRVARRRTSGDGLGVNHERIHPTRVLHFAGNFITVIRPYHDGNVGFDRAAWEPGSPAWANRLEITCLGGVWSSGLCIRRCSWLERWENGIGGLSSFDVGMCPQPRHDDYAETR